MPEGYILIPGSVWSVFKALPNQPGDGSAVTLREQVIAQAVVFPGATLAAAVARVIAGKYNGELVKIAPVAALTLTPTIKDEVPAGDSFSFSLSGNATVVWVISARDIAALVAGKTRDAATVALSAIPGIKRGEIILNPPWESVLPEDPNNIAVTVTDPEN